MTTAEQEDRIRALRTALDHARMALDHAVEDACPAQHRPVQHRDRQPPWCKACGRTANGTQVKAASNG